MAYLVHDAIAGAGAEILPFNAYQLRLIASSRKKTDRRDAYWIARALQTGMHPHPVYIPTHEIRELRTLLTRRRMIQTDRNRFYQLLTYRDDVDLEKKLAAWEGFYNYDRPHGAHSGKTHYEVLREMLS
jgi:hypothetical protein